MQYQDRITELKAVLPDILSCTDLKKKSTNNFSGPCPVCGGDDRFYYMVDSGRCVCNQCHQHAMDVIDFHRWLSGKTIPDLMREYNINGSPMPAVKTTHETKAISELSERPKNTDLNNEQTFRESAPDVNPEIQAKWNEILTTNTNEKPVFDLFGRRGLSDAVIQALYDAGKARFKNYARTVSVAVPYSTLQGETLAIQCLTVDGQPYPFTVENGRSANKVMMKGSAISKDCFFICGADIKTAKYLIIAESVTNVLTAAECFPDACYIALGGSTFTNKVKALKPYAERVEKVIVLVDNDRSSEKMLRAICDILHEVFAFRWNDDDPKGYDVNDLLMAGKRDRVIDMIQGVEQVFYKHESDPRAISPDLLKSGALSQGKIEIISAEEIRALNPQVEPLVEGFLNKGDNTLIVAPGGLGKSMLSTHMSLEFAVPYPEKLFERFPIKTRMSSLFFQTENSMATINSRMSKMAGDNPEYQKAMKYITFPFITDNILSISKSLENPDAVFWFIEAIKAAEEHQGQKINIVMWDPFVSFHDGQENDAGRMRAALDAVTFIAQATDITPIIIHHNNKNGDYRGSSAILDWGRNMISLTREFIGEDRITDVDSQGNVTGRRTAQIPCIKVKHEKSNNMPLFESFLLRMTDKLRFEPVTESIPAKQMEDCNAVSQALLDMGGYAESHNSLVKAYCEFSGNSSSTAKRHITEAVKNVFIRRESITRNGKPVYEYHSLES